MNKKELSDLHGNKVVVAPSTVWDGEHRGEERTLVLMSLTSAELTAFKRLMEQCPKSLLDVHNAFIVGVK